METTCIIYDSVRLVVPVVGNCALHMPHRGFDDFDTYCGAGKGIGDLIVPDDIYGIVISPACYIHDKMWLLSPPTTFAFNFSNHVFHKNIISIIDHFQPSFDEEDKYRTDRYKRAATYYMGVQSGVGPAIFQHMKRKQDAQWEYA